MALSLDSYFDRVVVINLARRPDRLVQFNTAMETWPFLRPVRFDAIDGATASPPAYWTLPIGAWGCLLSHRAVIDAAIADGVRSLCVLEDDACLADDFSRRVQSFLSGVPQDWDCLMLGAQHLLPPADVSPGIVQCAAANRAHAYAVRPRFMRALSALWHAGINEHCDVLMAGAMKHFKAYAPNPLLVGQAAARSDISGIDEPLRFWSVADESERVRLILQLLRTASSNSPAPLAA